MLKTSSFQEAIETVEKFSLDELEMLINILKNRLREQKRETSNSFRNNRYS